MTGISLLITILPATPKAKSTSACITRVCVIGRVFELSDSTPPIKNACRGI